MSFPTSGVLFHLECMTLKAMLVEVVLPYLNVNFNALK